MLEWWNETHVGSTKFPLWCAASHVATCILSPPCIYSRWLIGLLAVESFLICVVHLQCFWCLYSCEQGQTGLAYLLCDKHQNGTELFMQTYVSENSLMSYIIFKIRLSSRHHSFNAYQISKWGGFNVQIVKGIRRTTETVIERQIYRKNRYRWIEPQWKTSVKGLVTQKYISNPVPSYIFNGNSCLLI